MQRRAWPRGWRGTRSLAAAARSLHTASAADAAARFICTGGANYDAEESYDAIQALC